MKPVIVNNSKVPVYLSKISPIDIWAITLWPCVFCRGEMNQKTVNHESIHIHQYNDLFVIGFLVIYLWDYLHGLIKYRDKEKAYFRIRAEQEAYLNEDDLEYLQSRKKREWLRKYNV